MYIYIYMYIVYIIIHIIYIIISYINICINMMDSGKLIHINLKRNLEVKVVPGNVDSPGPWILADTDLIPRT